MTWLLYEAENYTILGDMYEDRVYLNQRKDGTLTLSQITFSTGPGPLHPWHHEPSVYRIRTPKRLIQALKDYDKGDRYCYDEEALLETLAEIDPQWAEKTREYLEQQREDNDGDK